MSYFANKTVLITGVAGFIGSHLCDAVLQQGAQVIGVDNFLTGREANIIHLQNKEQFTFIKADVTQNPSDYLTNKPIDAVFHFASPASPPRYQAHPVETYLVNSHATHLLLSWLKETNPQARFLFASTSEVYGDPLVHPQAEEYWGNVNPNGIRSCYDEAKRMGETVCGVFNRDFGIDTRIVRIFNTYGPRMDPTDGRVIPNLVNQALAKEPFTIYGDGSQTRSYCFVEDLVRGIVDLMTADTLAGETINIGNDEERTVLETAQIIHRLVAADTEFNITTHPMPKDDPTRRRPDLSKAKQLLDYAPRVDFTDGLELTIKYFAELKKE